MDKKEILIRKEEKAREKNLLEAMYLRLRDSLSEISKTKAGVNVLRLILHESGFLTNLTHVTSEGINKDLLLANEAKRTMYLKLRSYMDAETILRVEFEEAPKQEEQNG